MKFLKKINSLFCLIVLLATCSFVANSNQVFANQELVITDINNNQLPLKMWLDYGAYGANGETCALIRIPLSDETKEFLKNHAAPENLSLSTIAKDEKGEDYKIGFAPEIKQVHDENSSDPNAQIEAIVYRIYKNDFQNGTYNFKISYAKPKPNDPKIFDSITLGLFNGVEIKFEN